MSETADSIVIRVVAETERAERAIHTYGAGVERSMTKVELAVGRAGAASAAAASKQGEAYRRLGRQLVGAAADALEGKNAFQILGEQGTEVAATLTGFGGAVGRVAGFLAGPWGAAITTAVALAGLFAARTRESTLAAREEGEAARTLAEAIGDLDKISGANIKTKEQARREARRTVQTYLAENRAARQAARGVLELAQAKLAEADVRAIDPTLAGDGGFNGGAVAAAAYGGQIKRLRGEISRLDAGWVEGQGALRMSASGEILDDIEAELDPVLAAERRYEKGIERLRDLHKIFLLDDARFRAEAARLARRRDAAAGPNEPRPAVPGTAPKTGRAELTPADVRAGTADPIEDIEVALPVRLLPETSPTDVEDAVQALVMALGPIDLKAFAIVDTEQLETVAKISAKLSEDLAQGLTEAIVTGKSLGDVLVDSFARAGQALIQSEILQLLSPGGDGSAGFAGAAAKAFGAIFAAPRPPRRASGGHVSAGQLYRVNEAGIEGFRPAGSGTIVPFGRMAARPGGGGVTVVQPLNVSFAGAITTPELMAEFKAYADGVGQAAAIGGAAMAQSRMARRAARALPR